MAGMTTAVAPLLAAVEIGQPLKAGSLALFPLFHDRHSPVRYLTGAPGAAALRIDEKADGAVVAELEVTNTGGLPVLLVDGESLIGAKQNRTVTASVMIEANATVPVAVTCVEQGRWGAHRSVERGERHSPSTVRARNRHAVAHGERHGDQGGVWDAVADYATHHGVDSPTGALEDVHANAKARGLTQHATPLKGQCGVVAAIDDRIVGLDLFDSPRALAAQWASLVAGYELDAWQPRQAKRPRRRAVRGLLADIAELLGDRPAGVDARMVATALVHDDHVVHLAANVAG